MSPGHTTHTVVCSHVVHNILVSLPLLLQLQVSTPALGQEGLHTTRESWLCGSPWSLRHQSQCTDDHWWRHSTQHPLGVCVHPSPGQTPCKTFLEWADTTRYWRLSTASQITEYVYRRGYQVILGSVRRAGHHDDIFIILFKYLRYTTFILRQV